MTWVQAILLGVLYWCGASWITTVIWFFQKPLFLGFMAGLILGDPLTGALVGATINLVYIGVVGAGGSIPADTTLAGVLGTALAITGGLDAQSALAIAVPVGLLGVLLHYGRMSWNSGFVALAEKFIENGKSDRLWVVNVLLPQLILLLLGGGVCALACYFGAAYVSGVIELLGGTVLSLMATIGGMLPAVGIGLTLVYIFKDSAKPFLLIGFMFAAVFKLNLVSVGILGALMAVIYMQLSNKSTEEGELS
jgi:mannose/fructose/N-acetylgalactosamine-specific phosphotransferase system component IIC